MIRKILFLAAACAVPTFTACVTEGDDPALGTSEDAISVGRTMIHDSTEADAWVALTSQATCFLSGVTGQLRGTPYLAEPPDFGPPDPANPADVRVFVQNGSWFVHAAKGTGNGIEAHVQCISVPFTSANGADTLAWSDNLTVDSTPDATNRHCFLSRVWGTTGFDSSTRNVHLTHVVGSEWTLGGSVHNVGGDQQFGGAEAVCINVAATVESPQPSLTGPIVAGGIGITSAVLQTSSNTGACGLQQIKGDWNDWGPWGFTSDGVFVLPNSSSTYTMFATNGRNGIERCLH